MIIPKQRESLFVLLRAYHEVSVPVNPSTTEISLLLHDLEQLADGIIGMVLGLVRGDAEFRDWSRELNAFGVKSNVQTKQTEVEVGERVIIAEKLRQLVQINSLAQKSA